MPFIRFLLVVFFFSSGLYAIDYHFTETRYSDALGKSLTLHGDISLDEDKLTICYDNSAKKIEYSDEEVQISEEGKPINLNEEESFKLAQYFELVLMLFNADTHSLKQKFQLIQSKDKETLIPLTQLKDYIKKIEIQRKGGTLKSLEMFLRNDDKIKISVEDEVR